MLHDEGRDLLWGEGAGMIRSVLLKALSMETENGIEHDPGPEGEIRERTQSDKAEGSEAYQPPTSIPKVAISNFVGRVHAPQSTVRSAGSTAAQKGSEGFSGWAAAVVASCCKGAASGIGVSALMLPHTVVLRLGKGGRANG